MEAWHAKRKYASLTELSAEVGVGLLNIKSSEAQDLYRQIQAKEASVVQAGAAYESAVEELARGRAAFDEARRKLRAAVSACAAIGPVADIARTSAFAAFDRGDDIALAGRLETAFEGRGALASELSRLLVRLRRGYQTSQSRVGKDVIAQETATRELAAEVFKLQGLVASGRALLIANGVRTALRKSKRSKKQSGKKAPAVVLETESSPPMSPAAVHLALVEEAQAAVG